MIPKIIHYCWFGGKPLNPLGEKCVSSWKKMCPDYEIIRWDESNYDITKNLYMKQAYDVAKWGFVPDYARLDIIYNYGGIYLDTDVELLKPLDELLSNEMFVGTEKKDIIALGLGFGAEKGNILIKQMMNQYDNISFIKEDGQYNLTPSPVYQTDFFKENGFSICENTPILIKGCKVFPKEYFNPMDMNSGKKYITKNTFSIHHYAASWESPRNKFRGNVYKTVYRVLGKNTAEMLRKIFGKK